MVILVFTSSGDFFLRESLDYERSHEHILHILAVSGEHVSSQVLVTDNSTTY